MRIIFIGPPGSGKGTQSRLLSDWLGVPHLSTGEMIRDRLQSRDDPDYTTDAMSSGTYAPDQYVMRILTDRLGEEDCSHGYILDGFPRTMAQADLLDEYLTEQQQQVDHVLLLEIDRSMLLERLSHRAQAEGRSDDSSETIKTRMEIYHRETMPVLQRYQDLGWVREIPASGNPAEIHQRIQSACNKSV